MPQQTSEMSSESFDFAVIGASAFAVRLAATLGRTKRVVLIGRRPSPQRLPRSLDLALPMATRPETWRQLRLGAGESVARLTAVAIVTDTAASAAALDHVAHMALAYGLPGRRRTSGWSFPKVPAFLGERYTGEWRESAELGFDTEGRARISDLDAAQIVLADDAAILDLLPENRRPEALSVQPMTTTLTLATKRLALPIMAFPDRGVTLVQRTADSILALVSGDADVEARLASTLPGPFPVRRTATSRFRRLMTRDGAPLMGPLAGSNIMICAGLWDAGPFFAPAIARFLLGESSVDEAGWVSAHNPAASRALHAECLP